MAIKRIKVKNFKSFKELDVELGDLNILIGANASGKSNFVDIFRFLRNIENSSLNTAIAKRGGFEYLRNMKMDSSEPFSLEVVSDREFSLRISAKSQIIGMKIYETSYRFSVSSRDVESGFEVAEEALTHKCNFYKLGEELEKIEEDYGQGTIVLSRDNEKVTVTVNPPKRSPIGQGDLFPRHSMDLPRSLILERLGLSFLYIAPFPSGHIFGDIPIYDFDPKLIRTSAPVVAEVELAENGYNLAMAIKNIRESEDGKRKLKNLVTYLLDFVDGLDIKRSAIDKSFLLEIRETYSDKFLPVFLISDGTINMIALVVALYFEKKPLTIIEEPARGVHPYLISGVAHMLEDASEHKQIIVTTHNPEMVRYANEKDLLLISRDYEGFSSVSKPSDNEDLRVFLKNGLRMEDLYVGSFLETL